MVTNGLSHADRNQRLSIREGLHEAAVMAAGNDVRKHRRDMEPSSGVAGMKGWLGAPLAMSARRGWRDPISWIAGGPECTASTAAPLYKGAEDTVVTRAGTATSIAFSPAIGMRSW